MDIIIKLVLIAAVAELDKIFIVKRVVATIL